MTYITKPSPRHPRISAAMSLNWPRNPPTERVPMVTRVPADVLAPAFQVTLGVVVLLMLAAYGASRALPAAAPAEPVDLH